MKGMKGKFLKKLKSIRPVVSLKQGRILQVDASDGFLDPLPSGSGQVCENLLICRETHEKIAHSSLPKPEPNVIDVYELMRDLDNEETERCCNNKENIRPPKWIRDPAPPARENTENPCSSVPASRNPRNRPLSDLDVSSFRRPDLASGSLFDPDLLAAFEQAVMDHIRTHEAQNKNRTETENLDQNDKPPSKTHGMYSDPLSEFEERCPPGGCESVILYTTSLRGIRKTFEDCHSVRFLLESLRVMFYEKDVSMHLEFREELWKILGGRVIPPRLFIKGRYIGGADEVLGLHEQGKLVRLVQGIRRDGPRTICDGCGGVRFVPCLECNGSRKANPDELGLSVRCPKCNENGLIICPLCC